MLKITPYLGWLVIIVSLGGIFFPKLGFFLPIVFGTLIATGIFRGRWFCGNLCPRGSFNDFMLIKFSKGAPIPRAFRSMWLRIPVLIAMMAFMAVRVIGTEGAIDKVGMVFVSMCLITTAAAVLLGIGFSPRAWCTFCPMGTMQRHIGAGKHELSFTAEKCTHCNACERACPMQLSVRQMSERPDCIKCARCVAACPAGALYF